MNASSPHPPRLAAWLLRRCTAAHRRDEIADDLEELFQDRIERHGRGRAGMRYWLDVLSVCLRPALFRRRPVYPYDTARGPIMLKNYLAVALRVLWRHKLYAFINVAGLAVGVACCLLIALYVRHELSYDRFHARGDRIYRLVEDRSAQDVEGRASVIALAATSYEIAPRLADAFPDMVEHAVRFYAETALLSTADETRFQEQRFFFVDSTVFDVFSFAFVRGTPETALASPYSVVLTESTARRYFGDANPLGQTLTYEGRRDFEVTGVVRDVPHNAHFHFDFLASYASLKTFMPWTQQDWHWPPIHTYVLLAEGVDPATLQGQLSAFMLQHGGEQQAAQRSLSLQPLFDIHLHSHREDELEANGDAASVYLFSAIALIILLAACINFMNLMTARSAERAREIGMRKILGARRAQLARQFLGEAFLQTALALTLALAAMPALLPAFNELTGTALALSALADASIGLILLGIVLTVSLVAGSYPAFFLSAFRPVRVLKGTTIHGGPLTLGIRKSLVVFQFAVTCVLLIGTAVVYRQLEYVQTKKLGFDKEHVVVTELYDGPDRRAYDRLKALLVQHPDVLYVTATNNVLDRGLRFNYPVAPEGTPEDAGLNMRTLIVDHDYVETFGLELVAGRDFSEAFPTDTADAVLINEATAARLGWTDPVGKKIAVSHDHPTQGFVTKTKTVIGVVRDFHFQSLHHEIEPLLLHIVPPSNFHGFLAVRIRPGKVSETLAFLEAQWDAYSVTGYPFNYTFLDDTFDALFRAEQRLSRAVTGFALLAIAIACLGLFGLAAFTAEQRTKEIGVRKVLGASVPGLVALLSRDFLKLVALAFVVGAPVAYLVMDRWLDGFAYRVELSWPVFLLTGLTALLVAFLTVSYQAVKAAMADPVKSLRYE